MSTAQVEYEVQKFLHSDFPEVLCLRGKWGVGKTFAWKRYLGGAVASGSVKLDTYSYVSLFGVDSLDQFKLAIFENSVPIKAANSSPEPSAIISRAAKAVKNWRAGIGLAQGLPFLKHYVGNVTSLVFTAVNKTIICIDDLERKGDHLKIKDILGLISHLKERKDCKVMLILNEEELRGESQVEFDAHKEKVIDFSLAFEPTPQECAEIAFPERTYFGGLIAPKCVKLGISNIRIITKIERLFRKIEDVLVGVDESISEQVAHSLTLMTWAHASQPAILQFIKNQRRSTWGAFLGKDELSEEQQAWAALLDGYGFRYLDSLDELLLEGVERSFFDAQEIQNVVSSMQRDIEANRSAKVFRTAWDAFHNSFQGDAECIANGIYAAFMQSAPSIGPLSLDGTVRLFRELGFEEKANEVIAHYIKSRPHDRSAFDLASDPIFAKVQDANLRAAFKDKYASFQDNRDPVDVLLQIVSRHGWDNDDIARLSNLSDEDFYTLFKNFVGDNLTDVIWTCLRFEQTEGTKEISSRAARALTRIAGESALNRLRVQKFGLGEPQEEGD